MKKTADIIKDNLPQFDSFIYGELNNGNIKSEFKSLDRLIGGFLAGEVIILGARLPNKVIKIQLFFLNS